MTKTILLARVQRSLPLLTLAAVTGSAGLLSAQMPLREHALPPAPPAITSGGQFATPGKPTPQTQESAESAKLYSIGDPTAEEQLYLEYINRARANPVAEAERLAATTDADVLAAYGQFVVNLTLMKAQFAGIAPQPPLSMNSTLLAMARAHSQNMFKLGYQGHGDTAGAPSSLHTRIANSGYLDGANGWSFGENVFSYAYSPFYGHAGFEVDWGFGLGGMQVPPGHRDAIHSGSFREAGIGVVNGRNGSVGPQLVTQEFGRRGEDPFITGVVYDDKNGNGFYDIGEGIPDVRVDVRDGEFYAVTAQSGGYSVPVWGTDTYEVTFSGNGLPATNRSVTIPSDENAKLDLVAAPGGGGGGGGSPPRRSSLANIATRVRVGSDTNVLIGGIIITGNQPKKVIIRAVGPSLGAAGALSDPTLALYTGDTVVAENNDWNASPDRQQIIDSTVAPQHGAEAAIVRSLAPGAYTAVVGGAGSSTGIGLVEVYDLDSNADSALANIATRGLVETGDDVMIGGMIVTGPDAQKVIIRAIGPSLAVEGKLLDPQLELYDGQGNLLQANDNWQSDQQADIIATTIAPAHPLESAIVRTLPPAAYTAVVRGGSPGVALVEVYALN